MDLSTYFSSESDNRQYNVLEPPLGLMALETFLNKELKEKNRNKDYQIFY